MVEAEAGLFEAASVPDGYRRYLEPVIFEPWAQRLIDRVGLVRDQVVLDVASGTGVVARAAAGRVGAGGRVIASDISPGMLADVAARVEPAAGVAAVETLECSATELRLPDASVDVVFCQQGFQFIPDPDAAAREMGRVLRAGGAVGVAVWLSGRGPEPFDTYANVLQGEGVDEPFPGAYTSSNFTMSIGEVEEALVAGGFDEVAVTAEELELARASPEAAALGITGTPYGPAVATLDGERQRRLMTTLRQRMTGRDGAAARPVTTAVLGCGTAR